MKKTINPSDKFPISSATIHQDTIYVSGQIGMDVSTGKLVEGGITPQTHQALTNLKNALVAAGSSLDAVLKTTVFMVDLANYDKVNQVYQEYFTKDFPARSAVGVKALPADALIEIECIAALITSR